MSAIEHEMDDDEYEELLDEIYGDVTICGMSYSSGRALKELDPIAFNCGKSDDMKWECSECHQVYSEEDEAEQCCSCEDTVECEWCGTTILIDDAQILGGDDMDTVYFCSDKCVKEYNDNMDSHMGDGE